MRILVKIKPGSKVNEVKENGERRYSVKVKAPAKENKANMELLKTLSEFFGAAVSQIHISRGRRSRTKIIELEAD